VAIRRIRDGVLCGAAWTIDFKKLLYDAYEVTLSLLHTTVLPALFGASRWGHKCDFFRYTAEGKMTETDKCFHLVPRTDDATEGQAASQAEVPR
jgi:hypothetical protein